MSETPDTETVYVTSNGERYHITRNCASLESADTVFERPRSTLANTISLCKRCAGEYEPHSGPDPLKRKRLLEALDPDDIG